MIFYVVFFGVQVEYITLPGWKTSTEDVREFNDLPENAKKYVEKVEELVQVPGKAEQNLNRSRLTFFFLLTVKWIGVGKGRESIITIQ